MADRQVPRDRAEASRRVAALFQHWRRGDLAGVYAVLAELDFGDDMEITKMFAAFMDIGSTAISEAADGRQDEYLNWVLSRAALDEAMGDR